MTIKILITLDTARKYAKLLADARNRVVYISPNGERFEVGGWSPNYIEAVYPQEA
jgi:hypothetical protein